MYIMTSVHIMRILILKVPRYADTSIHIVSDDAIHNTPVAVSLQCHFTFRLKLLKVLIQIIKRILFQMCKCTDVDVKNNTRLPRYVLPALLHYPLITLEI